ncbi:hypothetical protein JMJ55_27585 [Belnapia sp. T6]|uniref:Uncharacterized protein n=1 Tax=Belnapia mucosa TaxID=2804532 RepID=A0ABS1VEE8_9PROT|nr:hypothetical protein [Belnapia mucosa]
MDPVDRLWILDTGSPMFQQTRVGPPKLSCVDLATNRVMKRIIFPREVALPTTYLNDLRFDLRRGAEGTAYITDSVDQEPNGIIVVDLATGDSWRRLHDHPTTKAIPPPDFLPVEGRALMERQPDDTTKPVTMRSEGIAIGADGARLYYCPLASRRLFSVSAEALADRSLSDDAVAATVRDEGDKGGGADGLESDAAGRIYVTGYEHNAILRQNPDGLGDGGARHAPALAGHNVPRYRRVSLRHGEPVASPVEMPEWEGPSAQALFPVPHPPGCSAGAAAVTTRRHPAVRIQARITARA